MIACTAGEPTTDTSPLLVDVLGPLPVRDANARSAALARFTGAASLTSEILATQSPVVADDARLPARPFTDEPCVEAWLAYRRRGEADGVVAVLRDVLVQLQFPIADGVRESEPYLAATRRGLAPAMRQGADFADPAGVRIDIAPTPVGHLPIISARARADFVLLVRALTMRNAPQVIPGSMGACIVSGYNNWDRVAQLRAHWHAGQAAAAANTTWRATFSALQADKALYQDRFVVLSTGPYSAVDAASVGRSDADWLALSTVLRREHECAHYVTRRVFGGMQAPLLDEVVADFCAIVAATGAFDEPLFLRCLGIESGGGFHAGGRLANYRGTPPVSEAAFAVLQDVVRACARSLARADGARLDRSAEATASLLIAITCLGLEQLAAEDGADHLLALYHRVRPHWPA